MSKNRWTSGLATAVSNGAPGCSCISNDRADAVEELVDSCEQVDLVLKTIAEIYPDLCVDSAPAVTRFRAAVARAKNWK